MTQPDSNSASYIASVWEVADVEELKRDLQEIVQRGNCRKLRLPDVAFRRKR